MATKFSYNALPSIEVADRLFTDRNEMLEKLGPILQQYGKNEFGVCLVHRHCELEEGERMVADGNVSQPEKDAKDAYPLRWLATGEAYEFNRNDTPSPSDELFRSFRSVVGNTAVLGLFYIRDKVIDGVELERTDGRKNITKIVPSDHPQKTITTAWHPQSREGASVTPYRYSLCVVTDDGTHIQIGPD
ncbi:hypothetical protein HYPSUDRAFT_42128 [Hypholoma sublateritium FD-334 SS-4]|uniref:Uncharacterized protein n=1 Tax=Hypholoma sublateritium (strain FD-334 SS-4) TaxID=945553 RepID=A0A0D2NR98_HYPSF|nr:hypothetical protein HYPSUDRAFT_42128 [Hypholoma sublateritium FD-334 SS-4]